MLTLGRQTLTLTARQLTQCIRPYHQGFSKATAERLLAENRGNAEPLLSWLGAEEIDSLDASTYEGATTMHDLNVPIPETLRNRFTVVIDGGTLEHLFNLPVALRNCLEMVAGNGHFISICPANNWFGHGFYQFSPELYFRVLVPVNGFELQRMIVCESPFSSAWYEVRDPAVVCHRAGLVNFRPTSLLVQAKRTDVVPVLLQSPQQSDYTLAWGSHGPVIHQSNPPRNSRRTFLSTLAHCLGRFYPRWLRNWLNLCFPFGLAPQCFRKVDLNEYLERPNSTPSRSNWNGK